MEQEFNGEVESVEMPGTVDLNRRERWPDLKFELGYENRYDWIAGQCYIMGTKYGDEQLLAEGQRLADMIREIRYDDRFSRVVALANSLEKRIARLEQEGYEIIDRLDDPVDLSPLPWGYRLEQGAGGSRIVLEKWRYHASTPVENDMVAQMVEGELDRQLGAASWNPDETQTVQSRVLLYETTYYRDEAQRVRKVVEYHEHETGNDDIGRRTTYKLDSDMYGEDEVRTLWEEIVAMVQAVPPKERNEARETWHYPTDGERPKVPTKAELLEQYEGLKLYSMTEAMGNLRMYPGKDDDSWNEVADLSGLEVKEVLAWYGDAHYGIREIMGNVEVMAIANGGKDVLMMVMGDQKLQDCLQIEEMVIKMLEQNTGTEQARIPAVYDQSSRWLLFPVSELTYSQLKDEHTSRGPSGTHYYVERMQELIAALTMGTKGNVMIGEQMQQVDYWDIFESDGEVYVDVDQSVLDEELVEALRAVGIKTVDLMELNQGEGTLFALLSERAGRQLNNSEVDLALLGAWDAETYLPSGWLINGLGDDLSQQKREHNAFLHRAANYAEHGGVPTAAILARDKDSGRYMLIMGHGHDAAERRLRVNFPLSEVVARIDGSLVLQPETDQSGGLYEYPFDYCPEVVTDREGRLLDESRETEVRAMLDVLAMEVAEMLNRKPVGVGLRMERMLKEGAGDEAPVVN